MNATGLERCHGGAWRVTGQKYAPVYERMVAQCRDTVTGRLWPDDTGFMCPSCKPACSIISSNYSNGSAPSPALKHSFCNKMMTGADMYMDGFKWTLASPGAVCLTFLFPGLLIDSWSKLVFVCMLSIFLASMIEVVTVLRRLLPIRRQKDIGLVFYLAGIIIAYMAMLLIMTYSLEIFFSVIVGLLVGHGIAKTCAKRSGTGEVRGAGTPCCRLPSDVQLGGLDPSKDSPLLSTDRSVVLVVSGMTCATCTSAVTKALENVIGVRRAQVNLQTSLALVVCSASVTCDELSDAVVNVGFDAEAPSERV